MEIIEAKFHVDSKAWLQVAGARRRELVIVEKHLIDKQNKKVFYVISYYLGTKAQSIVAEEELGKYYG